MQSDNPGPGIMRRRASRTRWRSGLPVVLVAGLSSWTLFADDDVARSIDAASRGSVDLVTAAGTRIVNMVDAAVATVEAAIALAIAVADVAAQIVETLSRLTSVIA